MKKFFHVSVAAFIAFAVFSLSSCQKEGTTNLPSSSVVQDGLPTGTVRDELPSGEFKKQLEVSDDKGHFYSFEIGSNDATLLAKIDAGSLSVDLNIAENATSEQADSDDHAIPSGDPSGRKFVSVQFLGSASSGDIKSYRINFSESFKQVMRAAGAATRIKLRPAQDAGSVAERGWWYYTPWCGKVEPHGDGGQIQTGVTVYRAYFTGSYWAQAPLHTLYFFNYSTCTKCAHGVAYLDDIWVFQDVLTYVNVWAAC